MSKTKVRLLYLMIFGLTIILRFSLIVLNREANDPHEAVANLIIQTGKLPQKDDCWECFQPKLYHLVFAKILQITGLEDNPAYQQNVAGQTINFFAGLLTLAVVYIFIKGFFDFDEKVKILAFSLIALNPNLIGINSQATNDSLVILFSTLAIFFFFNFLKEEKIIALVSCSFFIILAVSTKTNAWVTFIAIEITLIIRMIFNQQRTKNASIAFGFLFIIIIISSLNPLNQYIPNFQKYGKPIVLNINRDPFPHFSGEYSADASGIWYIGDGFFTFKFVDLIKHPRLDPGTTVYLPHQTSFWSILFGRAHTIHFDNAPPAWSTTGETIFPLLRILYILAIVPTMLLLIGFGRDFYKIIKGCITRNITIIRNVYFGLFVLIFVGYLSFQILFSLQYRSVTVIKAIFMFPALLSFPLFFMQTSKRLYQFLAKRYQWLSFVFDSIMVALLVCYVVDVAILIINLAKVYAQKHFL
jgi:hypothetical protein